MKLTLINLFEIFSTLFYYRDIYLSNFTLIWKKVRLERKRNNAHAIPKMTECVVNQSLERKILGGRKKKEEEEFSKNRAELKGHRFGHCSWGRLKKDKEKKGRKKKNRIVQGNSRQFEVALLRRTAFPNPAARRQGRAHFFQPAIWPDIDLHTVFFFLRAFPPPKAWEKKVAIAEVDPFLWSIHPSPVEPTLANLNSNRR